MSFRVPTYDQRVARIRKPGDEDRELARAKRYMMRLRRQLAGAGAPEEKAAIAQALGEAEQVLRKLRANIFDLGEMARRRAC